MFARGGGTGSGDPAHAPVHALEAALTTVAEAWTDALPPFGVTEGDPSVLVGQFSDPGLLAVVKALGALTRHAEGLGAVLAAEVARRSPVGPESFARRAGHASPSRLMAASRGGQVGRAVELVKVGQGTAARRTLTGEALPAAHPHVARALHAGRISVDAAHLIISMLDRVTPRANPSDLERMEELLTTQATQFPLHQVEKLVKHAEARLDPSGVAPQEEDLRSARAVTMRQDASGMFHLKGTLDPETGAPLKTALDAYATARLRDTRGHNHPESGCGHDGGHGGDSRNAGAGGGASVLPEEWETRSIAQVQADALADFARHILGCDTTTPLIPAITMVVRMELTDLQDRLAAAGYATTDGLDQPLSAAAARKLACDAGLIPAVFGGPSLPLDLGRRSRTFTRAQVLALWERDGGCAFCGQTSFVEAHHIRWWYRDHGPTNLSNAVLLCSRCHHLIHRDGWSITLTDTGEVTFTPPAKIDPDRHPRPAAPNPRRLTAPPPATSSRPPHRDDKHDRPPPGPSRPGTTNGRAETTPNPATNERQRQ